MPGVASPDAGLISRKLRTTPERLVITQVVKLPPSRAVAVTPKFVQSALPSLTCTCSTVPAETVGIRPVSAIRSPGFTVVLGVLISAFGSSGADVLAAAVVGDGEGVGVGVVLVLFSGGRFTDDSPVACTPVAAASPNAAPIPTPITAIQMAAFVALAFAPAITDTILGDPNQPTGCLAAAHVRHATRRYRQTYTGGMTDPGGPPLQFVDIHGYRRAYRKAGQGPVLLLLHGLSCDSGTWLPVIDQLAEHFTVVAPDLLGHGSSAKPNADYSLGGFANGMRDLLTVLGIDKVTVVGHSFGGGVAMQFAYQFPERTERVVLVSTGGLGREVTPLIRALTLPGANQAIAVATIGPLRHLVAGGLRAASKLPIMATHDLGEVADVWEKLADPGARRATIRVTTSVLDWRGQFVTMNDRAYLARLMPVLVIWGHDDLAIPVDHAQHTPSLANSEMHVFAHAGHFPHKDDPEQFVRLVVQFCADKPAAQYHRGRWRSLLRRGDQTALRPVEAGPVDAGSIKAGSIEAGSAEPMATAQP